MKNTAYHANSSLPLNLIVNRISASSLPVAIRKHSFIINDVPANLRVNTDEHMLATVFGTLLNTVIIYSENSCIRVSAKLYGKVALIHLKESPGLNNFAISRELKEIRQLAEMIGGTVSIGSDGDKTTSIVFSFINNLSLAA